MNGTAKTFLQVYYSDGNKAEFLLEGLSDYVVGRSVKKGQSSLAEVGLEDQYVSRRHCRIYFSGTSDGKGNWVVEDAGSSNGTKLNGFPVLGTAPVPENGEIHIGTCRLTLNATALNFPRVVLTGRAVVKSALSDDRGGETLMPPSPRSESTIMFSPATMAVVSEDATIIRSVGQPVMTDAADATIIRGVKSSAPATAGKDATIVRPMTRGATGSQEDATITGRKPREDATTMSDGKPGQDATMVRSRSDSTFVTSKEGVAAPTMIKGQDPVARTLIPQEKSPTISAVGATGRGTMTANAPQVDVESTLSGTLFSHQLKGATGEASVQDELNVAMRFSLETRLIRSLIDANYLDRRIAINLLHQTQQSGLSFFGMLARDSSIGFMSEIYRLVAKLYHMELIEDERALSDLALPTDWLPFNRALEEGMVILHSPITTRTRYGTIDPFNLLNHDWVVRCGGKPADKVLVNPHCFEPTLKRLKDTMGRDESEVGIAIDITAMEDRQIRQQITDVDVPQIVNYFLHRAHLLKASDIHVEPTEELLVVRNRVDGMLHEEITMPSAFHPEVSSRLKIMSGMDVAEKRRPQDGRFGVIIRDNPIDVRVSTYPTVYGEKIVMRLLDRNALRPSIDSLGLLGRDLRMIKDKLTAPYGLLMISGPTGSGKTTTLYSCLSSMDKNTRNVLTVEDPVEYRLKGVHQMQVNHKIGLTFASGLRTILRQDPDVIMVGEIRDPETANMAVQASLTGHIVFSTIHTNDAVGVITRMLDMGLEPFLVATSVSLAIAQRLIRKICPHCRTDVSGQEVMEGLHKDGISEERLLSLGLEIDPDMDYTQGIGCRQCRNSGYSGRRPVFEVFEMTEESRNMIMSPEFNADEVRQYAKKTGMTTLITHGMKLVEEQVTTVAEVIRVLGE